MAGLNGLSIYECGEIAMICSEGNIQESGGSPRPAHVRTGQKAHMRS